MGRLSVGKSDLYYETTGSGPSVVFLHGVGGNHASWYKQVRPFSQSYRVVTFDQRGFGNSPDLEQLGRSAMTDDLEALLDHLEIDKAILVAQSMGGGPCVALTCRAPGRVRALVLADTLVGLELPAPIEAQLRPVRAATANLSQIERVIGRRTRERQPDMALLYSQIASFNSVTLKSIKGEFPLNTLQQLADTDVPVLFIVGEDDVLAPPDIVRSVHAQLPGSEFHQIAEAGHSANFEAADAFNARVLEFLSTVR